MQFTAKASYRKLRKPIKDQPVEWGMYGGQGLTWSQVDEGYLRFMIQNTAMDLDALQDELARRELVAEAELSMAQQIIKAGYHALAQKYHPDRGGDANQMRELNAAHEGLKETLAQQPTV
jgi:hypothetical protein